MGPCIPGLRYVPDYAAAALHDRPLAAVDASPWQRGGGRGIQIYGFGYLGEARHDWKHGITPRPVDTWMGRRFDRGRRVSLTFRTVPAA